MSEMTMLAEKQRTVYPEEVTRQLHVIAQGRESSPVIDWRYENKNNNNNNNNNNTNYAKLPP